MKALIFTAALRVIRPAVQNADAEFKQPHGKPRPALPTRISPRTAIVDKEGLRQPITAEGVLQSLLHRLAPLIATGLQTHVVPRMVVEHRQGMAAPAIAKCHPAFKVHLPQQFRRSLLKSLLRHSASQWINDATMPAENLVHRRDRRLCHPFACETALDLARTPRRMRIAHRHNALFDRLLRSSRARVRTPGAIRKLPIGSPASKPLVPGVRMDPEPAADLPPVRPFLHRKLNKLTPLVHYRHLPPRHGWPPWQPNLHAMMMCRPCPRTPVGYVSGPNTCPGHPRLAFRLKRRGCPAQGRA